jgi:enoyl-CoA hydratase/carnithine racemase
MRDLCLRFGNKNALGTQSMTWICEELAKAGDEPVLLSGDGGALSAGLDLREVAGLDAAGMERFLRLLERTMTALYLHPGPTVAQVDGHAIAGGCVLALACDHRVAAADPKIRIGLNEVALGLRFPPRTLAIVRARVPLRHLGEVILGAGLHGPDAALRLGLVDEVAVDAALAARAALERLSAHPRAAYAASKRDLRGRGPEGLASDAAQGAWLAESVSIWTSPDVRARVSAVLGKKK